MDIIGVQPLYLRTPAVVLTKEGSRNNVYISMLYWRTGPQSSIEDEKVMWGKTEQVPY
ncbi:hypothetical protein [Sphingobacterium sp.]|uniref:hypothetical protein n=1 Tax=Sphingobacterium sp. TaxID=341027 RepID=UPI0028AA6AA8|nr:hypothetical protein [Sphingobacterium sp.]